MTSTRQGYVTLDEDMDEMMTTLYDTLHDAQIQLQGENYTRFVLSIEKPVEGQETYDAMEEIRGIAEQAYGKGNVLLAGNSTSAHDLETSFATDNLIISVVTALFVMIILFFTFQSAGLPVLLASRSREASGSTLRFLQCRDRQFTLLHI